MKYEDAINLEPGDEVKVKGTKEIHKVECLEGTEKTIFILLDNGEEYRHDMLQAKQAND